MISFIVPVLNEELVLAQLLDQFENALKDYPQGEFEVILVDGGSVDSTLRIAKQYPFLRVESSQAGRAHQLNHGAQCAKGSLLCFLHADSGVNAQFFSSLSSLTSRSDLYWGRFDIRLSSSRSAFRVIEFFINQRSRLTGIATGDQAIFVKRQLFEQIDGFPEIPLMEDVDLSSRLKKITPPICLPHKIRTSSRRWEENGVVKTVLLMWWLRFAFSVGVHPRRLALLYSTKKNIL